MLKIPFLTNNKAIDRNFAAISNFINGNFVSILQNIKDEVEQTVDDKVQTVYSDTKTIVDEAVASIPTGDVPYLMVQYSELGVPPWHNPPATVDDQFMRQKMSTDEEWGAPTLMVGIPGVDGEAGQFIATIYKAASAKPDRPVGNYAPDGSSVPTGWAAEPYDTGEDKTVKLWASQGICNADGSISGAWGDPHEYIIRAEYLKAEVAISAPTITGGVITGSTMQTAETGLRTVLGDVNYSQGIAFYNSLSDTVPAATLGVHAATDSLNFEGQKVYFWNEPWMLRPTLSSPTFTGDFRSNAAAAHFGGNAACQLFLPTHGNTDNIEFWWDNNNKKLKVNDGTTTYTFSPDA